MAWACWIASTFLLVCCSPHDEMKGPDILHCTSVNTKVHLDPVSCIPASAMFQNTCITVMFWRCSASVWPACTIGPWRPWVLVSLSHRYQPYSNVQDSTRSGLLVLSPPQKKEAHLECPRKSILLFGECIISCFCSDWLQLTTMLTIATCMHQQQT